MSQMHNEIWHGTKALILIGSDARSDERDLVTPTDKWDERWEQDTPGTGRQGNMKRKDGGLCVIRKAGFSQWEVS